MSDERLAEQIEAIQASLSRLKAQLNGVKASQEKFSYSEFEELKYTFEEAVNWFVKAPELIDQLSKATSGLSEVSEQNLNALETQRISLEFAQKTLQTLETAEQQALAEFIKPLRDASNNAVLEVKKAVNEIKLEDNDQLKKEVERVTMSAFEASQRFFRETARREFVDLAMVTAKEATARFYRASGMKDEADAVAQARSLKAENQALKSQLEALQNFSIEIRSTSESVIERLKKEAAEAKKQGQSEAKNAVQTIKQMTRDLREAKNEMAVQRSSLGVRDLSVFGAGILTAAFLTHFTEISSLLAGLF